jgi:hypothetical protein
MFHWHKGDWPLVLRNTWWLDIFSIQDKPIAVRIKYGVGVGIGIGIKGQKMEFGHEKPDVYRTSIEKSAGAFARRERAR